MKRQAAAYRERFNERTQRRLFILLFYTARLTRSRRMMKNIGTHDTSFDGIHTDTGFCARRPIDPESACERKCEIRFRKD